MNIYEPILVQKRPILIDENRNRSIFWPEIALFMPENELLWSINCEYDHFFKNHKNHHTLFLTYSSKTIILVKMKSQNPLDGAIKRWEYIISVTSVASESTGIDFIEANILFLLFEMTDKFVGW